MKVITNDIWLCSDCTMVAVNGDYSGLDYYLGPKAAERRAREIDAGLAALGPHLVPDDERGEGYEEFSHRECDCCGDDLAGSRHRFAILGEGEDEDEDEDEDESAQMTCFDVSQRKDPMKIYQIDVEVAATAYIQAKNKDEARRRLKDFIANGLGEMSGPEVSGLRLDDPALPEVSLSPVMTLLGPYENAGFEETNL